MLKLFVVVCLFFSLQLHANRALIEPYLIPDEHPIKAKLDQIFSKNHPLKDLDSLRKAGFKFRLRKDRFMIVAAHKQLKGYLLKLYVDNQPLREKEWEQWIRRVRGAEHIRHSIEEHGYQSLLRVPQKWIYAIPSHALAKPSASCFPKQYLLVVENMHIVSYGKNRAKYRFMMREDLLEALFVVLKENRLFDSMYLDNIPFCKDHTIAFIDTEHFHTNKKPMNYDQMLPHLSPKMQKFWKLLKNKQ